MDDEIKFTERGWSKLVEAVEQRNSTEGMSQLKLVDKPTVELYEEPGESEEEAEESEEECDESEEELDESEEGSGDYEEESNELEKESGDSDDGGRQSNSMLNDT